MRLSPLFATALAIIVPHVLQGQGGQPADSAARDSTRGLNVGGLGIDLRTRLETRAERTRDERCTASQLFNPLNSCRGGFQPSLDMQFAVKSSGVFGDRFHVNVDYDTQREFDASNTISLFYQGEPGERVERVELGNVSLALPTSRFVTSNIPSGNYGLHAIARFGPFRLRTIAAQQKGSVVQTREYLVGDRTLQPNEREVQDQQIEPRRFFFTVDPSLFTDYPRIDILDRAQLQRMRAELADTLRPTRIMLYRVQFGTQPQNPNGPRFRVQGDPVGGRQTYDVLREGVDYYVDPSLLWFALVRPLNAANERLVIAYNVRLPGSTSDTVWPSTGGTPDIAARPEDQVANLVWDPGLSPNDPAFRREIRSVYRIAGSELQRSSTRVRVLSGAGEQERPANASFGGRIFDTYLQMLGLAQANNAAEFDYENRIWPRPSDPVLNLSAGAGDPSFGAGALSGGLPSPSSGAGGSLASESGAGITTQNKIIPDYFLVLPSLHPFASRDSGGLIVPGNPVNDTIYRTPGEYLYSPQHPPSLYRFRMQYQSEGLAGAREISLGAVQLRPRSERITIDGRTLARDIDYRIDYDLGRVTFTRADTLFPRPRQVTVSYEENPIFAPAPTSLFGVVTELPLRGGNIAFTALSQAQKTSFVRPQLGFEPVSSVLAGITGQYQWNAPALTRLMSKLPFGTTTKASHFAIQGEIAASQPRPGAGNAAYVESFEGEGGLGVRLTDPDWYYSSLPAYGTSLAPRFGASLFDARHAATLTWQNNPRAADGSIVRFYFSQIDPMARFADPAFNSPEQILWLTLFPLDIGGRLNRAANRYDWRITPPPPATRRFRSIRTVLSPSGIDLTRSDFFEFWTLVDTAAAYREKNPTLVFDFGDVSENSVAFAPETLYVAGSDSTWGGKQLQGFDRLDTERDPLSRAFNVAANDLGLPGDVAEAITVVENGVARQATNVPICLGTDRTPQRIADPRTNCTRGNSRLDEEDIDLDNALNYDEAHRESEKILRYVVDLGDPARYTRVGGEATVTDTIGGVPFERRKQWVLVRVPLGAPDDSLEGVERRKIRALRLTMVTSAATGDEEFVSLPIDRLRIAGSPWVKRADQTIAGLGGDRQAGGVVLTGTIGTADRDSLRGLDYQSPPGVREQIDNRGQALQGAGNGVLVNEQSLRVLAVDLPLYGRAEAYYRFPTGDQNFMGYQELRLWGRGRNRGWGENGELEMFVKLGRDENNFYAYRVPVNAGAGQGSWLPEVRVRLEKLYELRRRVQNAYLQGAANTVQCTGVDSALVLGSQLPADAQQRYAACEDGYIVYTTEPGVTPPNLASVQELSVGFVRVRPPGTASPDATLPGDTLELWVDDIRLTNVRDTPGYAGQVALEMVAADVAELRVNASRRDPNFRQLGQQPSFVDDRALDIQATFHLEKLLPKSLGFALPLTVTHTRSASEPLFLERTDLRGDGIEGLRTPRTDATVYSLSVRRTAPIGVPVIGPLLDNLVATSSYVDGGTRSEYQTGSRHYFTFGIDWIMADSAKAMPMPGWIDLLLGGDGRLRWNPARIHFSSAIDRGADRRFSFFKPAEAPDDKPRLALSMRDLWRNGSTIELRPTSSLMLRWDLVSLRDLRQYGDTNPAAAIASSARERVLGLDAGFERERSMVTSISFAPDLSPWFRPRADYGTTYNMIRDPNTPNLVTALGTADSTLPRRLSATQSLAGGLTLDIPRFLTTYASDSGRIRRLSRVFAPIDVNVTRTLLSNFDGAGFRPPVGYQLGFGGIEAFRTVHGVPATTVGSTESVNASSSLYLPFNTAVVGRYRRTFTRNWIQRLAEGQARIDGTQTVFPDVSARWSWRPKTPDFFISALGANIGYSDAQATTSIPSFGGGGPPDLRRSHVRTYPVSASFVWAGTGGLSTTAGYTRTTRVDSLPGSINTGGTHELNVDVGRAFRLRWLGLPKELRTRLGWQRTLTSSYVVDALTRTRARLADQGRNAFSLNADTELNDAMVFSFEASRVVTYDSNANRRLNQFVLSTVLEIGLGR